MLNEIIAIYAITEDLLQGIGHQEDCRCVINIAKTLYITEVSVRNYVTRIFR